MIILQMEFNNLIWQGKTSLSAQPSLLSVCLCSVAAPVCFFPAFFTCGARYKFSCRDQCRAWNCISHSFASLAAAMLQSRLMEAFRQGNFQMVGSGHRVSGIDCWAKPLSQGRASTSQCPGLIQLPSALSLLRLGCMPLARVQQGGRLWSGWLSMKAFWLR